MAKIRIKNGQIVFSDTNKPPAGNGGKPIINKVEPIKKKDISHVAPEEGESLKEKIPLANGHEEIGPLPVHKGSSLNELNLAFDEIKNERSKKEIAEYRQEVMAILQQHYHPFMAENGIDADQLPHFKDVEFFNIANTIKGLASAKATTTVV